jgi:hypothetical protein
MVAKYLPTVDALVGVRLGVAAPKIEAVLDYGSVSLSKVVPTVGIFVKKGVTDRFSVGFEFDYLFQKRKVGKLQKNVVGRVDAGGGGGADTDVIVNRTSHVAVRSRGYAVRIIGTYKI